MFNNILYLFCIYTQVRLLVKKKKSDYRLQQEEENAGMHPGLQRHQGVVPQGPSYSLKMCFVSRLNNQNLCNGSWPQESSSRVSQESL